MRDKPTNLSPEPTSADAVVRVGRDGRVEEWDAGARWIFGRSAAAALQHRFAALFTPGCREEVERLTQVTTARPVRLAATGLRRDGSRFEAELVASAAYAELPKAGVAVLVHDVTARAAAGVAVAAFAGAPEEAQSVAALADGLRAWIPVLHLTLGVIEGDHYRRIANPAAIPIKLLDGQLLRLHGSPVEAALERQGAVVVHDTRRGRFRCDARLTELGVASYAVLPIRRGDEVFATLNVGFARPRQATARSVGLLSSVCEALALPLWTMLEFEAQSRAVQRLEAVDRLEKDFLALITHDMRTPLAVIAGFASSMREKWDELPEAEKLEGLDAIARNGRNLARLVEQDLQVALVERGELAYKIGPFDLAGQMRRIVSDFSAMTRSRFLVEIDDDFPLVLGDQERNWQVLANLLSNAVKFSRGATPIELSARLDGRTARIAVRDHGVGIYASDIPALFRKFSRVRSSPARKARGTGLGLYLAKCMVEAQGGEISVKSRRGGGSTFTYTLPLADAQAVPVR